MGTEFYLVDYAGKRAKDAHKAYWLHEGIGDDNRVEARHIEGHCQDWMAPQLIRFIDDSAGPVVLESEHDHDEGPPWEEPGYGLGFSGIYPIADGWTFETYGESPRTLVAGQCWLECDQEPNP